jgi:hypothetical protein
VKQLKLIHLDILSEFGLGSELEVHLDIDTLPYTGAARWPLGTGRKIATHLRSLGIETHETDRGSRPTNEAAFTLDCSDPVIADDTLRRMFEPAIYKLGETDWSFSSDNDAPVHALLLIDTDAHTHDRLEMIRADPTAFRANEPTTNAFIDLLLKSGLCLDAGVVAGQTMLYCELTPEAAADRAKTFEAIVGLYAEAAT